MVVGSQGRARLLEMFRSKADELLADPDLPPPKRKNITILKKDFGGAPYMVAIVCRPPEEDLAKVENPLSAAIAVHCQFGDRCGGVLGDADAQRIAVRRVPDSAGRSGRVIGVIAIAGDPTDAERWEDGVSRCCRDRTDR